MDTIVSHRNIISYASEITLAFKSSLFNGSPNPMLIRWFPPLTTGVKLNTDGCVYASNGKAGFGDLFRDHEGKWLLGYYGKLNAVTSLDAKLWGIYRELTIMFEKGYNNIQIESDSLDAVTLINGDSTAIHPNSTLIGDVQMLLMRTQSLLTRIFREANSSVDHLAHLDAEQFVDLVVTEESP